jgi:hypothetical protein
MDIVYEIRRRYAFQSSRFLPSSGKSRLSRPTVSKYFNTVEEPKYKRVKPISPKLGEFKGKLTQWLEEKTQLARPRRRTAHRLFAGFQEIGYGGAYDSVQRLVKCRKYHHHPPLKLIGRCICAAGICRRRCLLIRLEPTHEQVELAGVLQTIKVAHFWLAYSRQMFVVAYPRET